MDVEQLLRTNLTERADRVPAPRTDLHQTVRAGYRHQRRLCAGLAAAALALVLLVAGVPWLRGHLDSGGGVAHPGGRSAPTRSPDLYDIPTRGSLAGDAALVDRVAGLPWDLDVAGTQALDPPLDTRRVLFVGQVPGGRVWALVEGIVRNRTLYAWFTGADADSLALTWGPDHAFPDTPMALLDTTADPGVLVVVARPGDQVMVVALDPDGNPIGADARVDTVDGIATGTVAVLPQPHMLEIDVVRKSTIVYRLVPQQFDSSVPDGAGSGSAGSQDVGYAANMADCLAGRGFDVTLHDDGSFSYDAARGDPAVESAYDTGVRECAAELGYK